jgi:lysozyme
VNTEKMMAELERDEGMVLEAYDDATGHPLRQGDVLKGKLTIGVGRNLTDVKISKSEAIHLLQSDMERTEVDLDQYLPWWRTLSEVRQRVLFNMGFNMGVDPKSRPPGKLILFKQTLAMIQSGDFGDAAEHMLTLPWAKQVGPRAIRLADMMRTGQEA